MALAGFLCIIIVLTLIMTKKTAPMVALIFVPMLGAAAVGQGSSIGTYVLDGVRNIAPTGVMFIFSILYFGILSDAGTFQPIADKIIKFSGTDPVKILLGTAILTLIIHMGGSAAVTFMVVAPAMLPLYLKAGLKRTTLATVIALSAGILHILPWSGPILRVSPALHVSIPDLLNPLLFPMLVGIIFVLSLCVFWGFKYKNNPVESIECPIPQPEKKITRWTLSLNLFSIIISLALLITNTMAPVVIFMGAFAFAAIVNYPGLDEQKSRIDYHSRNVLMIAGVLFAGGVFVGIMQQTGMIGGVAKVLISLIPPFLGQYMSVLMGLFAMPAGLLFDTESFYFGILPILADTAQSFGIDAGRMGRAALLGQTTTAFPISPYIGTSYLLAELCGIDFRDYQKTTIPWAFAVTIVMLITSVILGVV